MPSTGPDGGRGTGFLWVNYRGASPPRAGTISRVLLAKERYCRALKSNQGKQINSVKGGLF